MSFFAKNLFAFSKNNELDINSKINKIQSHIRDLQREKHNQLPVKVKAILNIAFSQENGPCLFQQVYISCMKQSPIEWVPKLGRLQNIFTANSSFMKIVLEAQQFKVLIQKNYLPGYLFRNNLLNQKSAYHSISTSISGLTVPILDYVIIRLMHALSQSHFILQNQKNPNQQYDSDDLYFHLSRNPYLLILKNYMDTIGNNQKGIMRIADCIKMFFVDELLLKHRINKSTSYLREISFVTARYKLKPQNLLVVFFLLQKEKNVFEERSLFFYELIERFNSLIEDQNEIFFRFLFRIFIFAFSKNSVQNKVIDLLRKANPIDGYFELSRYSIDEFNRSFGGSQKKQKTQYNQSKPLLLKLFEKDKNLGTYNKVHFSIIRTLAAFLSLQIQINSGLSSSTRQKPEDHIRKSSQASSVQIAFEKIYRSTMSFLKKQSATRSRTFSKQNEIKLRNEFNEIVELFFKAYNRRIDLKKFEDLKESTLDRTFNIRGASEDFTLSVESYKKDLEINCWKVPLKDSEYQILYDFFYSLAKFIDRVILRKKQSQQPSLNLRYFSNPIFFMITVIVLVLLMKIFF